MKISTCEGLVAYIYMMSELVYQQWLPTRRYLQEPINCNDESDVISGKSDGGQHNHHGNQTCLRDAGSTNAGCSCCDTFRRRKRHKSTEFEYEDACQDFSYLMVIICPKFISMLLTWAMKMAANASYSAVPSMLMVAPTGSTKRVILLSILLFSSRHLKVTGSVAELQDSREEEDFKASTET